MPEGHPDAVIRACPLLAPGGREIHGLAPVIGPGTRVLVLGSMPGALSIGQSRYYAHPRNAFWRIVQDAVGVSASLAYEDRIRGLLQAGIGLWDVLASCHRHGSLDSGIEAGTMVVNDVGALLAAHPGVQRIVFNGMFAETVFRRRIAPGFIGRQLPAFRLPSTSPANAACPYEEKMLAWRPKLRAEP